MLQTALLQQLIHILSWQVNSSGNRYDTLADAYGNAAATDTISTRGTLFNEGSITFSGGKNITLYGGFDNLYTTSSGYTAIQGVMKVRNGKLIAKGIKIR